MRFLLTLTSDKEVSLPLGYQQLIQAAIYAHLPQELATKLHNEGYANGARRYKLFTFSKLTGKKFTIDKIKKSIIFHPPLKLQIGFAVEELAQAFALELVRHHFLRLGKADLEVESIRIIKEPAFGKEFFIKTLSPLSVYITKDDQKRYLTPESKEFVKMVKENIQRKYKIVSGKEAKIDAFSIEPIKWKRSAVRYKGGAICGVEGVFKVACPPEIFTAVYDAGVGANASLGFGMVEVVR